MLKPPKPQIVRQVRQQTVIRQSGESRLPKGDRVTAILGFTCSDGILLFADTEGSYEVTKAECDKLRRVKTQFGTIMVGTAGTLIDADYAIHRLQHLQVDTSSITICGAIEGLATSIYSDVGPLEIDMLLAVKSWSADRAEMFRWCGNLVYPIHSHACSGTGAIHLDPQLRFIDFSGSSDEMLLYGVKLMLEAKRLVQGVGGKTEAVLLCHTPRTYKWYGEHTISEIEKLVLDMERYGNRTIIPFIAGVATTPEMIDASKVAAIDKLCDFRSQYQRLLGKADVKSLDPGTQANQ